MITFFNILYSFVFSVISNSYIFIRRKPILALLFFIVFLLLNFLAGIFLVKTCSRKLKILNHGTTVLIAFCVSAAVSVILNIYLLIQKADYGTEAVILNTLICILCDSILFWNGIICVYLSSVQLGIKTRVIGLICGFIPVVNLIVLGIIIYKTYNEIKFESKKEQLNEKRKDSKICETKYPILLVHGVFFRDSNLLNYWGRIPKELKINGATCFYGEHQSAASVENSGKELAQRIKEIVNETNCEKVNIIAHSKGGLDCRFAIASCDISQYVASLTTINTPHRGCVFAEWLLNNATDGLKKKVAASYNKAASLLGDTTPDFLAAVNNLTSEFCKDFDSRTQTPQNIYCQSVGSVMHGAATGKFPLNLSHEFVKHYDGANDGLVGVDSFKWSENYTLLDLPLKRGISHGDMIDLNRENIKGFDVREFYVEIVSQLKSIGL